MNTHPNKFRRVLFLSLLAFLTTLTPAFAKRAAPTSVQPVVDAGIHYSAQQDNGSKAIIRATDADTGKALWEATIYEVKINPDLEADVQWVFIRNIKIEKGSLHITDEHDRVFLLDLKTRKVTSPKKKP